jgi:hypothetical protein
VTVGGPASKYSSYGGRFRHRAMIHLLSCSLQEIGRVLTFLLLKDNAELINAANPPADTRRYPPPPLHRVRWREYCERDETPDELVLA